MKSIFPWVFLLGLLLGWSGSASAAEADAGFLYVGLGLGSAGVEDDDLAFDDSDIAYKIFAGYQLTPMMALEGGYVNFGSPDEGSFEVDPTGFDMFGVAGFSLGPLRLFAKAGGIFWNYSVKSAGSEVRDDTGLDIAAGLGLQVNLEELRLGIRGEVEYFDMVDGIRMYSLGITYSF